MNCKPGDLAVIVADPKCNGADLGKIVEVLHAREPDERGPWWFVRSCGAPLTWVTRGDNSPLYGEVADVWLRPIRPESDPTSHESHRELESA